MIEFLSGHEWITPQIDFLLFLQNLREAHFEDFNSFFLGVTVLGEIWLPTLICALIYWCIDFRSGMYLFSLYGFNLILAQIFKMIACVYRPWVLSDKIKPVKLAIAAAQGYSFPSGHSCTASSVLGGLAFLNRKKKTLAIALILLILLVGFSRMWLGVHTPQDVIVGLTIGFLLVFILHFTIEWLEKDKNRYIYFLIVLDILCALALYYVCYIAQYRMDYVDNVLLVDPIHSITAFFNCYGFALGLINGAFLLRRFSSFEASMGSAIEKGLRGLIGAILIIVLIHVTKDFKATHEVGIAIVFLLSFINAFFISAIYPMLCVLVNKILKKD